MPRVGRLPLLVAVLMGTCWSMLTNGQVADLDLLDVATLNRCLDAELDDVFEEFEPNQQYGLDELKEAVLDALDDDGDEGDELQITLEELEDEMEEKDTTLEDEIDAALRDADAIARGQASPAWVLARRDVEADSQLRPFTAGWLVARPDALRVRAAGGSALMQRVNRRTTARQAVFSSERRLVRVIR